MARGKVKSIEERIAEQQEKVNNLQARLKKEKDILKTLQDKKDNADKEELLEAMLSSGKSKADIIKFLKK